MPSCLQANFYSHLCTSSMSFPYLLFKRIIQMNHNRTNHTIIPTRLSMICIYIYLCVLECVSVCPIHIRIWKSSIHWREKISLVLLVPNCWSYIVIEYVSITCNKCTVHRFSTIRWGNTIITIANQLYLL